MVALLPPELLARAQQFAQFPELLLRNKTVANQAVGWQIGRSRPRRRHRSIICEIAASKSSRSDRKRASLKQYPSYDATDDPKMAAARLATSPIRMSRNRRGIRLHSKPLWRATIAKNVNAARL
jgi:hypothetical protein